MAQTVNPRPHSSSNPDMPPPPSASARRFQRLIELLAQRRGALLVYQWLWFALAILGAFVVALPRIVSRPIMYTTTSVTQFDVADRYRELYNNGEPDADFAGVVTLALQLLRADYEALGTPTLNVRFEAQPDGRVLVIAVAPQAQQAQILADDGAEALARSIGGAGGREIVRNILGWELQNSLAGTSPSDDMSNFLRQIIRTAAFPLNRPIEPIAQQLTIAQLSTADRSDVARALEIREVQLSRYELPGLESRRLQATDAEAAQLERDIRRLNEGLQAVRGTLAILYGSFQATFIPDKPSSAFRSVQAILPTAPVDRQIPLLIGATLLAGVLFGWGGIALDRSARVVDKVSELWEYRELIRNLVLRDLRTRYKGSALGYLWTQLAPLLLMLVFWFVFSVMLPSGIAMFPVFLVIGLLAWNYCAEAVNIGARSIIDNAPLIKKVFFPREVLPLVSVFSSLVNFLLSLPMMFVIMIVVQLFYPPLGGRLNMSWAMTYLPVLILIQTIFLVGMALLFSSIAVFFRDAIHLLGIFIQFWFFLTPVVYSLENIGVSSSARLIRWLNPMASMVEFYHEVLYGNVVGVGAIPTPAVPALSSVLRVTITAVVVLAIGYWTFQRTSSQFGEEI